MQNSNAHNQTSALRLEVGQELQVRGTGSPRGKQVIMGDHYLFTPPYWGRPFKACQSADLSRYSTLTSLVPLLLSVQGGSSPSRDLILCEGINHIRLALDSGWEYGIAGETAYFHHDLDYGSRDMGKPKDYVLGGAPRAVIYAGREVAVAGYKHITGRMGEPSVFILSTSEVDDVRAVFKRGAAERWATRNGAKRGSVADITPHGMLSTHNVGDGGKLRIVVDTAGRVFELALGGKPQVWVTIGQERITVGEMITVAPIRQALGLTALETVHPTAQVVTANLAPNKGVSLQGAFARAEQAKPAPQKEAAPVKAEAPAPPTPVEEVLVVAPVPPTPVEDEEAKVRAAAKEAEAWATLQAARAAAKAEAHAAAEEAEARRIEAADTAYWAAVEKDNQAWAQAEGEEMARLEEEEATTEVIEVPMEDPAREQAKAATLWEVLKGTTLPKAIKDGTTGEVIVPAGEVTLEGSNALAAAVFNRPMNPKDEEGAAALSMATEIMAGV